MRKFRSFMAENREEGYAEGVIIDRSATVDPTVKIGINSTIGKKVILGKNVTIGEDVVIEDNANIGKDSTIEDGSYVPRGLYIYESSTYSAKKRRALEVQKAFRKIDPIIKGKSAFGKRMGIAQEDIWDFHLMFYNDVSIDPILFVIQIETEDGKIGEISSLIDGKELKFGTEGGFEFLLDEEGFDPVGARILGLVIEDGPSVISTKLLRSNGKVKQEEFLVYHDTLSEAYEQLG